MNYFWIVLIAIYIISPFDAHPLFMDDLIAAVLLLYMLYKRSKDNRQRGQYSHSQQSRSTDGAGQGQLGLEQAYRLLGVAPGSTADEISRAYRNKASMSHPDKVSHLSKELQEKARELTLELNEAYELLKKEKK